MDDLTGIIPIDFDKFISDVKNTSKDGKWIFRGQANPEWGLVTSFSRLCQDLKFDFSLSLFLEMLNKFVRRASDFLGKNLDDLDLFKKIAFSQHYGLATPFLDWTESPYIALFFALNQKRDDLKTLANIRIWALEISEYKQENVQSINSLEDNEFLILTTQLFNTKRIFRQQGYFTYHNFSEGLNNKSQYKKSLKSYVIHADPIKILKELKLMGITGVNIFDDLDYLASDIVIEHLT